MVWANEAILRETQRRDGFPEKLADPFLRG